MNIVQRNLFSILRAGAFNDRTLPPEPMSAYKWQTLFEIVSTQNLIAPFAIGISQFDNNKQTNLPDSLKEIISQSPTPSHPKTEKTITLANPFLNRKLHKIIDNERHSIDTSVETLKALRIIIDNLKAMLNSGVNIGTLIELGQYLRTGGHKIDFLKLERWIATLHLQSAAQFQGNILIEFFGFEPDELPFVSRTDPKVSRIIIRKLNHLQKIVASHSPLKTNSRLIRRNFKHAPTYLRYAPLETTSNLLYNIFHFISDIEE